jgi:16S rRNA (cytidine1402-2'-O)-methyltransferase
MVRAPGRLLVVATPIGNLTDLSPRAREALTRAALIAAEDTRRTRTLLQALGVQTPLVSLHAHNESRRVPELLARLGHGEDVTLVSDAGTPLLSDPGFELVRRAARAGFQVQPIPGPSAITAALAVAGLPTQRFCFEGFLPARAAERRAVLASLAHEVRTLVFFEAPHRIHATLTDLVAHFGAERQAVVARELTKAYETVYRGTLAQLLSQAQAEENFARGELTIVVHGAAAAAAAAGGAELRRTMEILLKQLPPGRAAAAAAQLTGAPRAAAYALATRGGTGPDKPRAAPDDEEMP